MRINYYSIKILFRCFFLTFLSIGIIVGLFSLLSLSPVYFNGKEYYGIKGFILSIIGSVFMSVVFSLFSFAFLNVGVFLNNKVFVKSPN